MNNPEDKNFGLSLIAFERMREKLATDNEELFEKIFLQQFDACQNYLIREDGATIEDAYDASMEALLALRAGIVRRTINHGNLRFLYTRMARQQYYKAAKKSFTELPDTYSDLPAVPEDVIFDQDIYSLLSKSWKQLGSTCRELLLRFYYRNEQLNEIANTMAVEASTLRKRKERCIKELRLSFKK